MTKGENERQEIMSIVKGWEN